MHPGGIYTTNSIIIVGLNEKGVIAGDGSRGRGIMHINYLGRGNKITLQFIMGLAKKQGCKAWVLSCLKGWLARQSCVCTMDAVAAEEINANYTVFIRISCYCRITDSYPKMSPHGE